MITATLNTAQSVCELSVGADIAELGVSSADVQMDVSVETYDLGVASMSADLNIESPIVIGGSVLPAYDGEHIVTPKAYEDQTLATKNKRMKDNVTVKAVPYWETSNKYGETVYIASEV